MTSQKDISATLFSFSVVDFKQNLLQIISVEQLLEIIQNHKDYRTVFRAAWALEHVMLSNQELLKENKEKIVNVFLTTDNWSALRSISKLIIQLFNNSNPSTSNDDQKGYIIDQSFKLLSETNCPIAVRCNLYDIIHILAKDEEFIISELLTQIEFELEKNATPAILSRAKAISKRIKTNSVNPKNKKNTNHY